MTMQINTKSSSITKQVYVAIACVFFVCMIFFDPIYLSIIFALCLTPIVLIYGFYNPGIFVVIFIMLSLFRIQDLVPQILSYRIPFILAMLSSISLFMNVRFKKIQLYWRPEMTYFLYFYLWVSFGVILAYNVPLAFEKWTTFNKCGILFFLIVWAIHDKKNYILVISSFITCGVILATIITYNKLHGIALVENTRSTLGIESAINDPNDLALYLLIPLSFAITAFGTKHMSLLVRVSSFISSIIITCGVVSTQSRGGLIGLASIFMFFISRYIKNKRYMILLGVITILTIFTVANLGDRVDFSEGLDESSQIRIEAWKAAIKMAIYHPLFGVSLNGFVENFYNYAPMHGSITNHVQHSSWFEVLSESGFVGFSLFLMCVYFAFKNCNSCIKEIQVMRLNHIVIDKIYLMYAQAILTSLIGYCVASSFLTHGFNFIFYTLFALSISLYHTIHTLKLNSNITA